MYVCMSVTLPVAMYVMGVVLYRGPHARGSDVIIVQDRTASNDAYQGHTKPRYACRSTANLASYKPAFPASSLKHRLFSRTRKVSGYKTTQRVPTLTRTRQRWR